MGLAIAFSACRGDLKENESNYYDLLNVRAEYEHYSQEHEQWTKRSNEISEKLSELEKDFDMTDAFSTSLAKLEQFWAKIKESFTEVKIRVIFETLVICEKIYVSFV